VALCQARISTKPLWGFSSSNPYPTQSRAEQLRLMAVYVGLIMVSCLFLQVPLISSGV